MGVLIKNLDGAYPLLHDCLRPTVGHAARERCAADSDCVIGRARGLTVLRRGIAVACMALTQNQNADERHDMNKGPKPCGIRIAGGLPVCIPRRHGA